MQIGLSLYIMHVMCINIVTDEFKYMCASFSRIFNQLKHQANHTIIA